MDPYLPARQKLESFRLALPEVSTQESAIDLHHQIPDGRPQDAEVKDQRRPRLSESDLRAHIENVIDFIDLPYDSKDSHSGSSRARGARRDSQSHFTIRADSSSPPAVIQSLESSTGRRQDTSLSSTIPFKVTKAVARRKGKPKRCRQSTITNFIDLTKPDDISEDVVERTTTSTTSSPEKMEALTIEPFSFPITPPSTFRTRKRHERSKTLDEIKQNLIPDNPYVHEARKVCTTTG